MQKRLTFLAGLSGPSRLAAAPSGRRVTPASAAAPGIGGALGAARRALGALPALGAVAPAAGVHAVTAAQDGTHAWKVRVKKSSLVMVITPTTRN